MTSVLPHDSLVNTRIAADTSKIKAKALVKINRATEGGEREYGKVSYCLLIFLILSICVDR